jgi:hypothetical protein
MRSSVIATTEASTRRRRPRRVRISAEAATFAISPLCASHPAPSDTEITPKLGTVQNGPLAFADPITETIKLGDTEVWEIYNTTTDIDPVHLHLVSFQLVNRQQFDLTDAFDNTDPANPHFTDDFKADPSEYLTGRPRAPKASEMGWKDTVLAYPGEVTRIVAKFDKVGKYVWHCHILSHEENDMMRSFQVVAAPKATAAVPASSTSPAHGRSLAQALTAQNANLMQLLDTLVPPSRRRNSAVDQVLTSGWKLPL